MFFLTTMVTVMMVGWISRASYAGLMAGVLAEGGGSKSGWRVALQRVSVMRAQTYKMTHFRFHKNS